MNELIEIHSKSWLLVADPRTIRITMLAFIARLAEEGPVRVLDGGNQFNAYQVARALHGQPALLERITVTRMFTCYQVLASLEKTVALPSAFIVLDLLRTFYDESIPFHERRTLLERCIPHLKRLTGQAGGAVSVHPPAFASPEAEALFDILKVNAPVVHVQETPAPVPLPLRFF